MTKMKSDGQTDGWMGSKAQEKPISSSAAEPWADTSVWGVFLHNIAKLSSDHSGALFQHQDENIMTITYFK